MTLSPTVHALASNPAHLALARSLARRHAWRLSGDPEAVESAERRRG